MSMVKLCRWFEAARRSVYYRPTKTPPTVKLELTEPIMALIEEYPSFDYRTVGLLGMNKEHGAENLPTQGLAGPKADGRQPPQDRSAAVGSHPRRISIGTRTYAGYGAVVVGG